ncbi:protein SCAR2 isoform X2 [Cicer arietinum]|uniref:Protein SCAR n=1 Tax=Cicer arietinum TaxID=3827 RepID=A0A1S2YM16_CICAR|nr:protein SCAR2 isoform X2 [Cicer arietinum]
MPLSKYLIRNEYGLSDPELYRAADKDDPEALLEAVAMAGLVGLLRQLGDLAEFAAEIFHDLHEEVMATAARGHGLTARVKQLEAEVPSLEKAFFSQTHHSSFFTNGGIDWHPNLRSEQNLVTRGNLPRLIMDSYEECRGPPRLFLLDKFDVAGAGACLKRYTDPSFFKMESASSVTATVQVLREKRNRKVKKKGARLRNGEAPNAVPKNAKLHQLLLEERIENGYSNPARLVKLKKRQLNGPSIEAKSGKSYMEKFLDTPSPDHKMICETSIFPLPVKPTADDTSEAGIKILEISSTSPVKKSIGDENTCSSPNELELELKQFPEEVGETNGDVVMVKEQISVGVTDKMSFNDVKVCDETELAINEQRKIESSLIRYHSDDVTSEVDNYLDALTTMESELETDDEYKPKKNFLNIQEVTDTNNKHNIQARFSDSQSFGGSSSSDDISSFKQERNEEHIGVKARLSDSHSTGTSSSDNNSSFRRDEDEHLEHQAHFSDSQSTGNSSATFSSSKKDKSYFPLSDSLSTVVENIQSEPILSTTTNYCDPEIEGTSSNQLPKIVQFQNADSRKFNAHVHEEEISEPGQASPDLLTSGQVSCSDLEPTKPGTLPAGTRSDETVSDNVELNIRLGNDADGTGLLESVALKPSSSSLIEDDAYPGDSSDKISLRNLVDDDPHIHSQDLLQVSNDSQDDSLCSSIEELDLKSGLNVVLECQGSKDEDCIGIARQLNPTVELSSGLTRNNPQGEPSSTEIEVLFSDLQSNYGNKLKMVHGDEITGSSSSVDPVEGDGHFKNPSSPYDHWMVNGVITEIVESKDQPAYSIPSVDSAENDVGIIACPASGLVYSPSRSLSNPQELVPASSDSYQMESNEVELTQISMDSNTETSENQLAPLLDKTSSDIHSPTANLTEFEDSLSLANPNEKELEVHQEVARESLTELEGQNIVGHRDIVSADVQMSLNKLVPCDISDLENDIENSSPREQIQQRAFLDNTKMVPEFSGFDSQQSQSTIYGQNDLLLNDRDSFSSPPYNQLDSETYLETHLQSDVGEQDGEFPLKYKENFTSEKSQSEQTQIYQLKQEGTHSTSESVSEIAEDESSSYSSLQSSGLGINPAQYVVDSSKPLLPDLFPKATEDKLDEVPPMPPLPPMQWRMGKVQHASLDSHREVLEVHQASVQPMLPIMPNKKSQFGLPASNGETLFYQNPFSPVMAFESDKLQHSSGFSVGVSGHPVALPFQYPIMVNEADGQYNYLVLDQNQIQNPFLTLPVASTSMHQPRGYIVASEGEMVQTSNPYAPILPAAYAVSGHDSMSSQVEPIQHPSQVMTETSEDDKTIEQTIHNVVSRDGPPNSHIITSEGEMVHDSNPCLPIPPAECDNSGYDSISPIENVTQSPSQLMTETRSDDTILPQHMDDVIFMDRPPHSHIIDSEEEMVQNNNPCSPIPSAESAVSEHDSISPEEKPTQPPSPLRIETSSETTNHYVSNVEEEQGRLFISHMLPPNMESVDPNQSFLPFEGEMSSLDPSAQTSDFGSERINGKPKHKIPRPRNPLIDAVAAHDKSKLRRVTERIMPQIAPKLDERDSWLEQIRTKSFSLKPAVATRPSIQGPKTNLKLAAILEKANSIRQALAGSDEDDEDSWSDS